MSRMQLIARNILNKLENSPEPLSTKQLADGQNCSTQTIRNHITWLMNNGYIKESELKHGKTVLYMPTGGSKAVPAVRSGGKYVTLRKILFDMDEKGLSKSPISRKFQTIVFQLFLMYAQALDENSMERLSYEDLKTLRHEAIELKNNLQGWVTTLQDLLNDERVWDLNLGPKTMVLNDEEIPSISSLLSLLENIANKTEEGDTTEEG